MPKYYLRFERASSQSAEVIVEASSQAAVKKQLGSIIEIMGKDNCLTTKWFGSGIPSKPKLVESELASSKRLVAIGEPHVDIKLDNDNIILVDIDTREEQDVKEKGKRTRHTRPTKDHKIDTG